MVDLCATSANPPGFLATDTIIFDDTTNSPPGTGEINQQGEFFLFGGGFRNDGTASFSVQLPALCRISHAFLYVNFYYDNDAADPSVTELTGPQGNTIKPSFTGVGNKIGLSGSTCNPNDNPEGMFTQPGENTSAYLRNRVYRADVRGFMTAGVQGNCPINGIYSIDTRDTMIPTSGDVTNVAGDDETTIQGSLPGNSEPPGVRVPGCKAGQGCTILVVIEWLEAKLQRPEITLPIFGIVKGPLPKEARIRKIRIYHGAVTLVPTDLQGDYLNATGGTASRFFSITDTLTFAGDVKVGFAAGDTEDNFLKIGIINGQILYNRAPPGTTARGRGILNFLGQVTNPLTIVPFGARQHLLSNREISGNVRNTQTDLNATIVVGNDCVCWFLFVISSDESAGVASLPMNNHMEQFTAKDIVLADTSITVQGNNSTTAGNLPFPGPPFFITVHDDVSEPPKFEIMKVTNKSGVNQTVWKVDRAQGGTEKIEVTAVGGGARLNLNGTRQQMINWYGRRTTMQRGVRNRRPDAGRDE